MATWLLLFQGYPAPRVRRRLEVATSPLLSCGEEIRSGYITLAITGIPSARYGEETRRGYISRAVLGGHMWAKWLHNPCRVRGPRCQQGEEITNGYLTQLSQGPICGQNGYITLAVSGVFCIQRRDEIRSGHMTPIISGVPNAQHNEEIKSGYLTPTVQ